MTISSLAPVEEKYSSVKQLIELGKEKGYLLYDEIYEMLPEEVVSLPDELDEIYLRFADLGVDVIDRPERYQNRDDFESGTERVRQERGRDDGIRSRRSREDQRPGAHVPARDGHRPPPRPRGRGGDRPAHRAGRVDDLRGAVREPGGPARAPAPQRDGDQGQADPPRAGGRRSRRAARPQGRRPHQGEPQDLRADRRQRRGDRRAAQAAEALQAGRREVPGDRARDRPPGRQDRQGHPHGRLQRADPQPAGRLPQGHRQAVLPLRAGHQAGADGAQARDQRGAQGAPPPADREVPRQPARAGGALRHHPRRDRVDDQQDPARARRPASGPRKN